MLSFAAFTPHPLVAIPDVGRENANKIRQTMKAFRELSGDLYASKPETIVVISPHQTQADTAFTINQRPSVLVQFSEYGNLADRIVLSNDLGLGYAIKESLETTVSIRAVEDERLDYGCTVPLYHLIRHLNPDLVRLVVIGSSSDTIERHYAVGAVVNRHIHRSTKRIAVIASGDLAHGANRTAVAGFAPAAAAYNKEVYRALKEGDTRWLLQERHSAAGVTECGSRVLGMLLGILGERKYRADIRSFENALGVGYLAAQFELS